MKHLLISFLIGFLFFARPSVAIASCDEGDIPSTSLVIPSIIDVDANPPGIRIENAPEQFRDQYVTIIIQEDDPDKMFPFIIQIYVQLDSNGNAIINQPLSSYSSTAREFASEHPGVQLVAGIWSGQDKCTDGWALVALTINTPCLALGDDCVPGSTNPPLCEANTFCASWGLVTLPELKKIIPAGIDCAYVDTSGIKTCGTSDSSHPYTCDKEIETGPNLQETLCCINENECNTLMGTDPTTPGGSNTTSPIKCATKSGGTGIDTAIGCIPMETNTEFLRFMILWSIGVSGGTGLVLLGYSSFLIMADIRDPRRKSVGRDMFWSTLSGFFLLILSVYLLNAIGIGILGLVQIGA